MRAPDLIRYVVKRLRVSFHFRVSEGVGHPQCSAGSRLGTTRVVSRGGCGVRVGRVLGAQAACGEGGILNASHSADRPHSLGIRVTYLLAAGFRLLRPMEGALE